MEGFGFRMPWYLRMTGPVALWSMLKWRWIPRGFEGPRSILVRFDECVNEATAVDKFCEMTGRVEKFEGEYYPSPLFGKLTSGQWREIHLIHAQHHLRFLVPRD